MTYRNRTRERAHLLVLLVVVVLLLMLVGCVSVHGPCTVEVDATRRVVQCEGDGTLVLMPPSTLEAAGRAAHPLCVCEKERTP
jgi:hypothetical protein